MQKNDFRHGPRVLMVGYNGANNTGAEALLQSDIEDVRAVLGPGARITVPTLNEANLRRYLAESATLRISRMPTLFFGAIRRLVRESDLVLLVEGSTYMDTWGSPLLWAFLWATRCAARMRKPCLAYAVDAGALSPANQGRVRRTASRTGLIVTRTRAAAERLRALGVTAPLAWTADNAFTFRPKAEDDGWLRRSWPSAASGMVGFAPVDFSLWPAVMRPWGAKDRCYKWPYYFSRSPRRLRFSEAMARGYAHQADRIVETSGKAVALICMEQLDEPMANSVLGFMRHGESARVFSAREHDASRMTVLLRSLDLLVTSRFHAAVLSLAAGVPQIAVGHDTRLRTLYSDLGLGEWFIDPLPAGGTEAGAPEGDLFENMQVRIHRLLADRDLQQAALHRGFAEHLGRARGNRALFAAFVDHALGEDGGDSACAAASAAAFATTGPAEPARGSASWVA